MTKDILQARSEMRDHFLTESLLTVFFNVNVLKQRIKVKYLNKRKPRICTVAVVEW